MRVLLMSHSFAAGGAGRYVREMHQQLKLADVDVKTWVADRPPSPIDGVEPIRSRIEACLLPLDLFPALTDWRHRGSIRRFDALSAGDVDLVHLNLMSGGWCSLAAMGRLTRRLPVVWTHHDEWAAHNVACLLEGKITRETAIEAAGSVHRLLRLSPYHESFKSRSLGRLLDRSRIRPAIHICPSHHMAGLIQRSDRFRDQPVAVIPHGTALAGHPMATQDRGAARAAQGIPANASVILLVSANVNDLHKGFYLAADAMKSLHARRPIHLLVLGRGSEAINARMAPVPVTAGYAGDDAELARAYRAADVTLIPSLAESYSYVAVESMACGTPYVSFNVGGPAELSLNQKHALLASCFDPEDLGRCVEALLADAPRRAQMGEWGRQWVHQECRVSTMLHRTREVYARAIEVFGAD